MSTDTSTSEIEALYRRQLGRYANVRRFPVPSSLVAKWCELSSTEGVVERGSAEWRAAEEDLVSAEWKRVASMFPLPRSHNEAVALIGRLETRLHEIMDDVSRASQRQSYFRAHLAALEALAEANQSEDRSELTVEEFIQGLENQVDGALRIRWQPHKITAFRIDPDAETTEAAQSQRVLNGFLLSTDGSGGEPDDLTKSINDVLEPHKRFLPGDWTIGQAREDAVAKQGEYAQGVEEGLAAYEVLYFRRSVLEAYVNDFDQVGTAPASLPISPSGLTDEVRRGIAVTFLEIMKQRFSTATSGRITNKVLQEKTVEWLVTETGGTPKKPDTLRQWANGKMKVERPKEPTLLAWIESHAALVGDKIAESARV